jgi:hypothetical protein
VAVDPRELADQVRLVIGKTRATIGETIRLFAQIQATEVAAQHRRRFWREWRDPLLPHVRPEERRALSRTVLHWSKPRSVAETKAKRVAIDSQLDLE